MVSPCECLAPSTAPTRIFPHISFLLADPVGEPFPGLAWPLGWMVVVVVLREFPWTNHISVFWTVHQSQISITCIPLLPPLLPDTFLPPRTWGLRVTGRPPPR